ncbi:MAG: precorrin-6A reductase [Treponema sp.]|nr:precorrin-6A reductase [Treponema sp.]
MSKVFVFAGTTEGRKLFELLKKNNISCTVSVATDYGANLLSGNSRCKVLSGRMSKEEMLAAVKKSKCLCLVDATHPFAQAVTSQIKLVCAELGVKYVRLLRDIDEQKDMADSLLFFDSVKSAAEYVKDRRGNVFVASGAKDLNVITDTIEDKSRIFARVLPSEDSLLKCIHSGLCEKNIIAMQGPFSSFMNEAMFRETKAKFVITKESGAAGGFEEKIIAAKKCGAITLVVKNPESKTGEKAQKSYSYSETVKLLETILKKRISFSAPKIILAGIGPGGVDFVTKEVFSAVQNADVVFGAKSILANPMFDGKKKINSYMFSDVSGYLQDHPECENPLIAFSGDSGFYSGARAFAKECEGKYSCSLLPGISSVNYFSAKIGSPWQDWKLLSMHGKYCNVESFVKSNQKCFVILSGKNDLHDLLARLGEACKNKIIPEVKVTIGFNLSREDENIICMNIGTSRKLKKQPSLEMLSLEKEGLYSVLVEHQSLPDLKFGMGIKDSLFCRKNIPMTKRDVRLIILNRMSLAEDSIVYDIGCGTGSVTVEAALIAKHGFVYAVDKNKEAVALTKMNLLRFGISNAKVVQKTAPDGLCKFPVPDCAFIGGSSGNLIDIIKALLKRNPLMRIVLSAVTLETFCMIKEAVSLLSVDDLDFTQVSISHSEKLGKYNFVKAENPVWVVSFSGSAGEKNES